jgi:hypothetical protein
MIRHSCTPAPEELLLIHVAAQAASPFEIPNDAQREDIHTMASRCRDWSRFLSLAYRQKCEAAAWRFALDYDLAGVMPENAAEHLREQYEMAQARYLKKNFELNELNAALQYEGIDALVIKGVPMAQKLYTDAPVRVSTDIDILCREEDLEGAARGLATLGYLKYDGHITTEEYRRYHYHYVYVRGRQRDSVVEVHWNIRHPYKGDHIDMSSFWDTARAVNIGGAVVRSPDTPHALLQLGVNLSYNTFFDLRDLGDLRRLALAMDEDQWTSLMELVRASGTTSEVSTAHAVGEQVFGSFLPSGVRRRFTPPKMIRHVFLPACTKTNIVCRSTPFKHARTLLTQFLLRKGLARKLEYLYRLIAPTRGSLIETRNSRQMPSSPRGRVSVTITGAWILFKLLTLLALSPFVRLSRSFGG